MKVVMTGTGRPRGGATTVEFAVALLPMCLFLFGVIEYGRYQGVRHSLTNASREGCRLAAVGKRSVSSGDVRRRVEQALHGQRFDDLAVDVFQTNAAGESVGDWRATRFGDRISVRVSITYRTLFPSWGFLPETIPITTRATMTAEVE